MTVDRKGCHAGRLCGKQLLPQRWIWGIHCMEATKHASARSTLALKLRVDVIRSPKQGYQWPHKKYLSSLKIKIKILIFYILFRSEYSYIKSRTLELSCMKNVWSFEELCSNYLSSCLLIWHTKFSVRVGGGVVIECNWSNLTTVLSVCLPGKFWIIYCLKIVWKQRICSWEKILLYQNVFSSFIHRMSEQNPTQLVKLLKHSLLDLQARCDKQDDIKSQQV